MNDNDCPVLTSMFTQVFVQRRHSMPEKGLTKALGWKRARAQSTIQTTMRSIHRCRDRHSLRRTGTRRKAGTSVRSIRLTVPARTAQAQLFTPSTRMLCEGRTQPIAFQKRSEKRTWRIGANSTCQIQRHTDLPHRKRPARRASASPHLVRGAGDPSAIGIKTCMPRTSPTNSLGRGATCKRQDPVHTIASETPSPPIAPTPSLEPAGGSPRLIKARGCSLLVRARPGLSTSNSPRLKKSRRTTLEPRLASMNLSLDQVFPDRTSLGCIQTLPLLVAIVQGHWRTIPRRQNVRKHVCVSFSHLSTTLSLNIFSPLLPFVNRGQRCPFGATKARGDGKG